MSKINHKYLEEAKITSYADNSWDTKQEKSRIKSLLKTKEERGVDPRDCWALDTHLLQYLYEHLCAYVEDASQAVDLTFHKFEYEGKEYTQIEMIELLKDYILKYFKTDSLDYEGEEDGDTYLKHIFHILYTIFPSLWW